MDGPDATEIFSQAVLHIARLENNEAEDVLMPEAEKNSVSALTLLAEVAWVKALMTEDKSDLKEATIRLAKAEARAVKACDGARGTLLGSLYRMASLSSKLKFESDAERIQEFVNCTNLAYVYMMEALASFRGSPKTFISGAFKLKSAWRLYRYLSEHELHSGPAGSSSSIFSSILSSAVSTKADATEARLSKAGLTPVTTPKSRWRILSEYTLGSSPAVTEEPVKAAESSNEDGFFDATDEPLSPKERRGEGHPELPSAAIGDVNYGLGGFHFFVSMIPTGFKWIVESLGFKGDRDAGRRELEVCVDRQGHRAASAMLLLLWMDTFFYKDRENAEKLLLQASERFEEGGKKPSPLFRYLGGYLARVQGHLDVAVSRFTIAQAASKQAQVLQQMCDYEIGWCYYLQCDFERAIQFFEPFMKEFKSPSYRAYCAYQLGCSLDIMGRLAEAKPYMASVEKLVRKNYTFDQYAARKAAQWLKAGQLSDYDKAMIVVMNHLEAKNFAAALTAIPKARKTLTTTTIRSIRQTLPVPDSATSAEKTDSSFAEVAVDEIPVTNDSSAFYVYCLGRALRGVGRFSEAMECYQRVIEAEAAVKEETFILPYTYCEIGELLLREGKFHDARQMLRISKTRYLNYDFDKPLGRRLKLALDLVKERKTSYRS